MVVALVIAGYVCGSIPFGLLVGWLRGVDIRTRGSGNIGATNVGRVLGRLWGLVVFALDLLKGLLPVLAASRLISPQAFAAPATSYLLWMLVAAAAILGHMFPPWLGFRGGKGVATSLGVLLGIYPFFTWAVLAAFGLWVVVTLSTRYVSMGSIAAAAAIPVIFALLAWRWREQAAWRPPGALWPFYLFSVVIAVLVIYRHRGNIRRLRQGTESRIGRSAAGAAPPAPGRESA